MNKRVRSIWTEVCHSEMPELDETCMTLQRQEKFAKLIVKECGNVLNDNYPPDDLLPIEEVTGCLKRHFGVE
jgi:hypothetical protein